MSAQTVAGISVSSVATALGSSGAAYRTDIDINAASPLRAGDLVRVTFPTTLVGGGGTTAIVDGGGAVLAPCSVTSGPGPTLICSFSAGAAGRSRLAGTVSVTTGAWTAKPERTLLYSLAGGSYEVRLQKPIVPSPREPSPVAPTPSPTASVQPSVTPSEVPTSNSSSPVPTPAASTAVPGAASSVPTSGASAGVDPTTIAGESLAPMTSASDTALAEAAVAATASAAGSAGGVAPSADSTPTTGISGAAAAAAGTVPQAPDRVSESPVQPSGSDAREPAVIPREFAPSMLSPWVAWLTAFTLIAVALMLFENAYVTRPDRPRRAIRTPWWRRASAALRRESVGTTTRSA